MTVEIKRSNILYLKMEHLLLCSPISEMDQLSLVKMWAEFGFHCHYGSLQHTDAAAAKSLQSCPTLCDPIDGRPPGSPVPGILQEWVAISFSNAWKWKVKVKSFNRVWLLATPWTAAYQAPLPMGFSRQEYWSGLPLPSPLQHTAAAAAKLLQLCPTLCDPIDGSLQASPSLGFSSTLLFSNSSCVN